MQKEAVLVLSDDEDSEDTTLSKAVQQLSLEEHTIKPTTPKIVSIRPELLSQSVFQSALNHEESASLRELIRKW